MRSNHADIHPSRNNKHEWENLILVESRKKEVEFILSYDEEKKNWNKKI